MLYSNIVYIKIMEYLNNLAQCVVQPGVKTHGDSELAGLSSRWTVPQPGIHQTSV